jgi:hypothetical protein
LVLSLEWSGRFFLLLLKFAFKKKEAMTMAKKVLSPRKKSVIEGKNGNDHLKNSQTPAESQEKCNRQIVVDDRTTSENADVDLDGNDENEIDAEIEIAFVDREAFVRSDDSILEAK